MIFVLTVINLKYVYKLIEKIFRKAHDNIALYEQCG